MTATFLFRLHILIRELENSQGTNLEALKRLQALAWQSEESISDWLDVYYEFLSSTHSQASTIWENLKTVLDELAHAQMTLQSAQLSPTQYWAKAS